MVRGLAVVSVFLLCVIALIVMQPGLSQKPPLPESVVAVEPAPEATVTREQVNLLAEVAPKPEADLEALISQAMTATTDDMQVAAPLTPVLSATNAAVPESADVQHMTWNVLRDLNSATGHAATPGAPGSLLNVLVERSLTEADSHLSSAQRDYILALTREAADTF